MQKYFVCFVRDAALSSADTSEFMTPMFYRSLREAARDFHAQFHVQEDNPMKRHPEDYDMYSPGVYKTNGEFQTGVPRLVARGINQLTEAVSIEDEFGGM